MTRPNFIEAEAIQRAITWAEVTGGRLYIVHMSTAEGADLVKAAQARGVDVYAETCAQYLVLDDSVFARPDGHLYACCPQVKKTKDQERLWKGLNAGEVCVISTDTCTFTQEQKAMWKGDWTKIPMGLPGLETLVPLVYTRGVLEDRLPLTQTRPGSWGSTRRRAFLRLAATRTWSSWTRTRRSRSITSRWKAAPTGTRTKGGRWRDSPKPPSAVAAKSWTTIALLARTAGGAGCRVPGRGLFAKHVPGAKRCPERVSV
jgi:hypothetical protein